MERTPKRIPNRKTGERSVPSVAIRTLSVNEAIGEALRGWSAKFVARRIKTSTRTVEAWREGKSGPQAKHFVAMLQDDELCARLLEAAGRGDLADSAATIAKLRAALGAVEGK
jgi:hypothetical protein